MQQEPTIIKGLDPEIVEPSSETKEMSTFLANLADTSSGSCEEIVFDGDEKHPAIKKSKNDTARDNVAKRYSVGEEPGFEEEGGSEMFSLTKYRWNLNSLRNENEEEIKYPADCYSLMSLNGPSSAYFWFGFLVFFFQMVFIILIVLSVILPKFSVKIADDNPEDSRWADMIATEADALVRTTQIMSLIAMLIFADASMIDVVKAVHTFPNFELVTKNDKIGCIVVSCLLRFIQGVSALVVALVLVISSSNVIDIILNFTALNFISCLDDVAFEFASSGKYGPQLKAEVNRIAELDLPVCMYRKNKYHRYMKVLIPLTILIFGIMGMVIYYQEHPIRWESNIVRVEIVEEGLETHSGCYRKDYEKSTWKRDFYHNDRLNNTFGFCIEDKIWYLYKGNDTDPCEAEEEDIIVHSADTDTFDISTSFLETWYTNKDTPADLYFVENIASIDAMCGHYLGDGICDEVYNNAFQRFDDGDCCAATCASENCGQKGLINAFGSTNRTQTGFSNCRDPKMQPLTIKLNNFTSSRDPERIVLSEKNRTYIDRFMPDFWTTEPEQTLLIVYCDDEVVLSFYIDDSMKGEMETIRVSDGAECEIFIENSTTLIQQWDDTPVWYVDYTIYRGDIDETIQNGIEILHGDSFYSDEIYFELVPKCYIEKLGNDLNMTAANIDDEPSSKAIHWVMDYYNNSKDKICQNKYFRYYYALAVLNFAAPRSEKLWIEKEFICIWPSTYCPGGDERYHFQLNLVDFKNPLSGSIATEIGMISILSQYNAAENNLTGTIPSEIGLLTDLNHLELTNNELEGSIPTELCSSTSLESLLLSANDFTGTIPTKIGLLTNLLQLNLSGNNLVGSVPSEIGLLTALTSLEIASNRLIGSIPSEFGLLTNLSVLDIDGNSLDEDSIPDSLKSKILEECIPCDGKEFKPNYEQVNDETCSNSLEALHEGTEEHHRTLIAKYRVSIERCDYINNKCVTCSSSEEMMNESLSILDEGLVR